MNILGFCLIESIIVFTRNVSEWVDVLQLHYVSYAEAVTQSNITSQRETEKQKLFPKFITLKSFASCALEECRNGKSRSSKDLQRNLHFHIKSIFFKVLGYLLSLPIEDICNKNSCQICQCKKQTTKNNLSSKYKDP